MGLISKFGFNIVLYQPLKVMECKLVLDPSSEFFLEDLCSSILCNQRHVEPRHIKISKWEIFFLYPDGHPDYSQKFNGF